MRITPDKASRRNRQDSVAGFAISFDHASLTLAEESWTSVASNLTTGTWTDTNPSENRKFYRVVVE